MAMIPHFRQALVLSIAAWDLCQITTDAALAHATIELNTSLNDPPRSVATYCTSDLSGAHTSK